MARRVDKIDDMVIMDETYGTRLHGDASLLLIVAVIKQLQLACLFFMDEPVGRNQAVRQSCFTMVHMRYYRYISDLLGLRQKSVYFLQPALLSYHLPPSNTFINSIIGTTPNQQ